jgi:phage terminase Nu1 subunit (DNA packaging protein)
MGTKDSAPHLMTQCQIAEVLGHDRRTVAKVLRMIPVKKTSGGRRFYDVEKAKALLAKVGGRGIPADKRGKLLDEQIRKLQLANDLKAKLLVPKAEVTAAMTATATRVAAILRQRLENEYPMQVAGLDAPQARVYGKRVVDEVLREVQGLAELWA